MGLPLAEGHLELLGRGGCPRFDVKAVPIPGGAREERLVVRCRLGAGSHQLVLRSRAGTTGADLGPQILSDSDVAVQQLVHQAASGICASRGEVFPAEVLKKGRHADLFFIGIISPPWVVRDEASSMPLDGVEALDVTKEVGVCDR